MKKKPQLPRKLGKPNALRKSLLNNRRDIENNNENKQLSQCVFLGVLRLKPVPTTFSRTSVPPGSTSFISHRLRRHRNNNIAKENNKNTTKGVDLNKVIGGKITKKNPDKVRACVKKNPLGTSKVLRICLTMNRAIMNLQSNNSEVVNVTDIPFPTTSFVVAQPSFNPVDNLFNKLKQQMKHVESPGSLDVPLLTSTVAKMNASRQLTTHAVKAKRKQSDHLTVSNDNNSDDIIWISDSGAIDHNTQTSNDDIIFIDDSREVDAFSSHHKSMSLQGTSTSATVPTNGDKHINSHMQNRNEGQAAIGAVSTKLKQATSSDQKIYEVDDHDSSSDGVSHNKSIDKQKERGKSRRNRLIPAEIPLKYVNAPRLLRSELYQKADQKRSTSLEGKDRTKEKSKSLKSEKVTFTIIKSSSEHNLSNKSRPELTVRMQKSQDTLPVEQNTSVKEKKKSSSPKNKNSQHSSDRWEITSLTQLSDQPVSAPGSSQKTARQGEQPVSFKLKLTKTTRSAVAAAKATASKEMVTDDVIYVEDTRKDTSSDISSEKPPFDNGESLNNAVSNESNAVINRLFTPRLLRSDLTSQKPITKVNRKTNFSINPSVKTTTRNVTIKDLNTSAPMQTLAAPNITDEDVLIIIDDADDTNANLQVPARSSVDPKISEEEVAVVDAGNEQVPRSLKSDISHQSPIPNKLGNGTAIDHPTNKIEGQLNTQKTRTLRSETLVKSSNKELQDKQEELPAQNQVHVSTDDEPSSKGTISPRVLRSDVSQKTLNNTTTEEQNHLVASKPVTSGDKLTGIGSISPISVLKINTSTKTTDSAQLSEQSEDNTVVWETGGRELRSEVYNTITNEGLQEKHAELVEKEQHSKLGINDEKILRNLRSDAKECVKTGSMSHTQPKQVQVGERTVESDVAKVIEIPQIQLTQSADNQSVSEKNLRTLRAISPHKSGSPKSSEMHEVEQKDQPVDVKRFYSTQSSKLSPLRNMSSEPSAVPSKSLGSSSEQMLPDVSQKSKENLLATGKEQLTCPEKSSISQEDPAPKLHVENPPSRMLRSDPRNIPDGVQSLRKTKKHEEQRKNESGQGGCSASHESSASIVCKSSKTVVADEKNGFPVNSNDKNPGVLSKLSKESAGTGTKLARSRSSSPNKAKSTNFDEIIVLSEKKSRKSKEAAMKITKKGPLSEQRLPVKQTSSVEPSEEVVVIIHEEPKSKSSPLLESNNHNQENGHDRLQQDTEHLRHNLRSQKHVLAEVAKQPDEDTNTTSLTENSTKLNDAEVTAHPRLLRRQQASSSRSSPEEGASSKAICPGEKAVGIAKTTEAEVITQVTSSLLNYDASELQRVATARVLRSETKTSDINHVSQDNKAESPASTDAKKVSFKTTPEVFVKDNIPKKTTKSNLRKKINYVGKETSMGRSILKKGKLGAKSKIIKTMSKVFAKKQTLKVKVNFPDTTKSTQSSIKPAENAAEETTCYNEQTTHSSENLKPMINDKSKKIKTGKKIVFATKTKEHTKRNKKQQIQKVCLKKGKAPIKGRNSLPLALRRLLTDGRISRKTLVTPGTRVTNTDDSESNKENVISKVENVVEKNIGPKTKKEQTKQKLLARMKQTITKSRNKELKPKKYDKKGDGKPRVRNSNGTTPKSKAQKKINTTPPSKKHTGKVALFKKSKTGKGVKPKVDKKEKKGKANITKVVKSLSKLKINKLPVSNVENNSSGAPDNRRTAKVSTATIDLQTNISQMKQSKKCKPKLSKEPVVQDYTSKPGDSSQTKTSSVDKKNKNKKIKKCGPEAIAQVKVSEKSMKIPEKRKRKETLPSVKKIKLSNAPASDCISHSCENNAANANTVKENKSSSSKNVSSVKATSSTLTKKGKIKKNKVDVQAQTVPTVGNLKLAHGSDDPKDKKKKSIPKKSEADISDAASNVVVARPRVSLRKNRIDQSIEDADQEFQDATAGTEATKKGNEIPIEIKDPGPKIVQKRARKSIPEEEKPVGSRKSTGGKIPAVNKRLSKRTCVIRQSEQEASKKECDVKKVTVSSCDSAVNTTITLPPGTSIEPIVIDDVKEEDLNKPNTSINNNVPTKSSLSVFDFNESDMELNTPPLLTLQNIREEIKEKYTYQKEHAQDATYVVPHDRSEQITELNNVTYTLSSSNPLQDHNKTYTTLNPVPNASSKDALSALNTSVSVKEPESHTFSPPQKSTPKMTKSINQAKGPKLYSVIPAEEIVRKRMEQAEHLKTHPSQSIDLTSVPEQQVLVQERQERQIQVRRPSQIYELTKIKHNLLTGPSGVEISGNTIQVKSDKVSPATSNTSTFEDLFKSPIKSPKKSPLKQTTILDMFAKMQQKNIIKSIFSQPEASQQGPRSVAAPMKESDSSDMPPPKLAACGEDEDSDGESRMEWVPEEYAEYKFKYTAKKVMSYKPIYKCKVCLQMFPTYYKLNKHKREHSETDNPYKCPQCESSFNSVADLAAHIRVHKVHVLKKIKQPEKRFRCDVCLKEFSRVFEVERHIRRHNLSKHLLIHLDVRPFNCEICGKAFGRSDVLVRHELTHSVAKPVKCPHCDKDFIRHMQLKNHMKKRHKEFYDDTTVDGVPAAKDESTSDPATPKEETVQPHSTETKSVEPESIDPLATV
nr:unnamed protein product [Callosobruchus analis]